MKKFLITILVVVVVAVGAMMVWLATLDGAFNVERSITVNKPNADVYALVQDFNHWESWSPWLCMEPEAKVEVTGSGKAVGDEYSWKGELVGSGTIKHVKTVEGKSIEQDIVFNEPMTTSSFVYWEFESINDSTTKVTWGMKGEMPFFLRFMTKMMDPMVGMDYERGLKMIKDKAEIGYVASKIEIVGFVDAQEFSYMGERVECGFDELDKVMEPALTKVTKYGMSNLINFDRALTVYHDFDFMKQSCDITMAIPIKDTSMVAPQFEGGVIPQSKALKIKFTGDYKHVGNAWATAMTYTRTHKIKENKTVPSYEVYLTNPQTEPDPRKWITEVYIPVKE